MTEECRGKFRIEKGKWYLELEPGSACERELGRMVELPDAVVKYISRHIKLGDIKMERMLELED